VQGGRFLIGKFNVTLNCLCSQAIRMKVNSMQRNPDAAATGNGAWWHAGVKN